MLIFNINTMFKIVIINVTFWAGRISIFPTL